MLFEEIIRMALDGLRVHKLRSILTMLGIIFGVGAVIAMLSIGEGAKREALKKFQTLGVNNIIIRDKKMSSEELEEARAKFSKGLAVADGRAIGQIVPGIELVAPQAEKEIVARFEDKSIKITLVGVTPEYRKIMNYNLVQGEFLDEMHHNLLMPVCVIGAAVSRQLFSGQKTIGQKIKLEDQWYTVIGVMENKTLFTETVGELAARNLNQDVYIPLSSFLFRFAREEELASEINQLTVKVAETDKLMVTAEVIERILLRRHHDNKDYDLIIPYELLKQEEKEREIYNILLGSIASISLLVGGIGIMNIMLATVLERTREIGIRRAMGARRREIMLQFLIEAVGLSLIGGLLGIFLGITLSYIIDMIAKFSTSITAFSVLVAFLVSGSVGSIFGTFPARRAAEVNPIDALRYE